MDTQTIRCTQCNKKAGLTAIECKCGNKYCSKHRYAEEHLCTYDYKENYRKEMEKNMKKDASMSQLHQNQNNSSGNSGNCAF